MALVVLAACSGDDTSGGGFLGGTTTQPEGPTAVAEVGRWSNHTDLDTEDFTVQGTWELHWNIRDGSGVAVRWYEPGAEFATDDLDVHGEGPGQTTVRKGGTYYLRFTSIGGTDYEFWVVDVP